MSFEARFISVIAIVMLGLIGVGLLAIQYEQDYVSAEIRGGFYFNQKLTHNCYASEYYPYTKQPEIWCRVSS